MQLDPQSFLRLAEKAKSIAFFDIEATGLRGDYNAVLVVSIRPYHSKPITFHVDRPGIDRDVVKAAKAELEKYDCWVSYYGKGYDIPMLNTRLLRWSMDPIEKRHHVDMYFTLKANILMARRSQAHQLRWLGTPQQKMDMSAEEWNEIVAFPKRMMPKMIDRCESDTSGLQALYDRTKHLIRDIKL